MGDWGPRSKEVLSSVVMGRWENGESAWHASGLCREGIPSHSLPVPTLRCAQIGTPPYMSPEMWLGRPYSLSSDVWALGCVALETAILRPAFSGDSEAEVKAAIIRGRVPLLPRRYSDDLNDVITAMLTRDPIKRPTITEVGFLGGFVLCRVVAGRLRRRVACARARARVLGTKSAWGSCMAARATGGDPGRSLLKFEAIAALPGRTH